MKLNDILKEIVVNDPTSYDYVDIIANIPMRYPLVISSDLDESNGYLPLATDWDPDDAYDMSEDKWLSLFKEHVNKLLQNYNSIHDEYYSYRYDTEDVHDEFFRSEPISFTVILYRNNKKVKTLTFTNPSNNNE